MNKVVNSNSQAAQLVSLIDDENRFDIPPAELRSRQLEAANERFQDRVDKIKLLQNRAEDGNVSEVRQMADIVPLLFAHTAYKSYPENWLMESRWDRLGKWLDTVSTNRVPQLDTSEVKGLDDWLNLLSENEHYVSCSSGTTGKCAMMNATTRDLEFAGNDLLQSVIWSGLKPNHDRRTISMGQVASTPKNRIAGKSMVGAFIVPGETPFAPNVPPITIGGITEMVVLRKKIADGTAQPSEIAYYEEQARTREQAAASAVEQTAENIIANRDHPLFLLGLYGSLYRVAEIVRERGYSSKDFRENCLFISGGLKRAQVPDNYKQIIYETFNLSDERICQTYGMQELNSNAVRCSSGRYHLPPWMLLLLLDESGETLIEPPAKGEIEGRAGFLDLSMDGRWGGVISGDKVRATWETCSCGNRSPSIHEDIQRYADMATGDKIACSGTIDAYVRGVT